MNLLLLAAEGAGEETSGLTIILPAAAELVYGAIAFVIVYFVISKLAFPKLNTMLEERRVEIQGKMEAAEASLQEAEESRRGYEASIRDARGEAARIVEDARGQAEQVRANLIAQAEEEAASIRERARADAASERERTLTELRGEVGRLSVELASRIVGKELDATTHQSLVDEYIQSLSRSN